MRWILVLLIAANVIFFAWQYSTGSDSDGPEAVVQARPQPAVAPELELLSETEPEMALSKADNQKTSSGEGAAQSEPLCWMLGPLPDKVTAKQILLRFDNQGMAAELKDLEVTTGLDYLLYIGPFGSKSEGMAKLHELQSSGVDSFLITRGALDNAISLGLFSSVNKAEAALDVFTEQGYQAHIRENERMGVQQWLIVPMADADRLDVGFWDELKVDFGDLERKQNWCSAIAPAGGID